MSIKMLSFQQIYFKPAASQTVCVIPFDQCVFINVERELYCAQIPQKLRSLNSKSKHSKLAIYGELYLDSKAKQTRENEPAKAKARKSITDHKSKKKASRHQKLLQPKSGK